MPVEMLQHAHHVPVEMLQHALHVPGQRHHNRPLFMRSEASLTTPSETSSQDAHTSPTTPQPSLHLLFQRITPQDQKSGHLYPASLVKLDVHPSHLSGPCLNTRVATSHENSGKVTNNEALSS